MNAHTNIAHDLAAAIGKTSLSPEGKRQLDMRDAIKRQRDEFAVRFYGMDPAKFLLTPRGASLSFAKEAATMLNDYERVALMIHLLDNTEFDDPDLRTEAESVLSDISGAVA